MEAYTLATVVALLIGVLGFIGKKTLERMDAQEATMQEIRDLLQSETKLLREAVHSLDVRITRIEERCAVTLQNHFRGGVL